MAQTITITAEEVGPQDPTKDNSPMDAAAGQSCTYNGANYSDGAYICTSGRSLECVNGVWRKRGTC